MNAFPIFLMLIAGVVQSGAQEHEDVRLVMHLANKVVDACSLTFALHLKNIGDRGLLLPLGTTSGNGREQYLNEIRFSLVNSSHHALAIELLRPAGIARQHPGQLIMPLSAGAEVIFPIDLKWYGNERRNAWDGSLDPGAYTIQAIYRGAAEQPGLWSGSMRSLPLPFQVSGVQANYKNCEQKARSEPSVQVSGGLMAGRILTQVKPIPLQKDKQVVAKRVVVLDAIVGPDGLVKKLRIISGPESLRAGCLKAVRQWTYRPYLLNGQPVTVETTITARY